MSKRFVAFLLALCLTLGMFPVVSMAAETEELETITATYINPVYASVLDESDLTEPSQIASRAAVVYHATVEEAAAYMRDCMEQRQETITVGIQADSFDGSLMEAITTEAFLHTGEPTEGDYLERQFGGWNANMSGFSSGSTYNLKIAYTITYYTTAAQEEQVDAMVDELLAELGVDSLPTDYEKIKAVYDWMTANIDYDYTNLYDDSYLLKYTAYAALINKTAVCQGYANLLYRLALEMDIDSRIITGIGNGGGHAWNIVELDGKYYNADATWDINFYPYRNFLKCDDNFYDHTRDDAFTSETFYAAYPMGTEDYDPDTAGDQEATKPTEPEVTEPVATEPTEPEVTEPEVTEPTEPEVTEPAPDIACMDSGNLAVEKPSKVAIQQKYRDIATYTGIYTEEPSVTAPYSAGALTDSFLENSLTYLNYARFAANLPAVQLDDTMNDYAQHGAVVLAANDLLSHYPTQPEDMDDDFYDKGYSATTTSNIGAGYGSLSASVQGCLDDSTSVSNLSDVGHRRWLLNPTLLNVGFGFARSTRGVGYSVTKVFDTSGASINYDFISWPASGNFPTNLFGTGVPWSVSLNPNKYETPSVSTLKVTITRESDGEQWTLDASTGETPNVYSLQPYLTVDTNGYSCISNCIIFYPGSGYTDALEGVYTVDISGIYTTGGKETAIRYQVDFFDVDGCLEHSYEEAVTAPTCTEQGYTTYICTYCGKSYMGSYVSTIDHTVVTDEGVDATCTTAGLTEGSHCAVCGTVLVEQTVLDPLGHNHVDGICTRCGAIECNLDTPEVTASNIASTGKIKLSWNSVEGAVKYQVYRSTDGITYTRLTTVKGTSVTNTSAVAGVTYYYYVAAVDENGGVSDPSEVVVRTCMYARPTLTLSNIASSGKIKVKWTAVSGAAKYEIYYRAGKTGEYTRLTTAKSTSVNHNSAKAGVTYYYKVRALDDSGEPITAFSSVKYRTCDLARPTVTLSNIASSGKIKISWKAVTGAVKYRVYCSTDGGESYTLLKTTTGTSLNHTSTTAGKKYYYKVRAVADNSSANSADSSVKSRTCDLAQPKVSITLNNSGKPKLSWKAVSGAVKYKVYCSDDYGESYRLLKTTTGKSLTHSSAVASSTYCYYVVAVYSSSAANSADSEMVFINCSSVGIGSTSVRPGIIDRINEYRADYGLQELVWVDEIEIAAQIRAAELKKYPSTYRPDGTYPESLWYTYGIYFECDIGDGYSSDNDLVDSLITSNEDMATVFLMDGLTHAVAARCGDYWCIMFCAW